MTRSEIIPMLTTYEISVNEFRGFLSRVGSETMTMNDLAFEAQAYCNGNSLRGFALMERFFNLRKMMEQGLPLVSPGSSTIPAPYVAAAATCPLHVRNGGVEFDREEFIELAMDQPISL